MQTWKYLFMLSVFGFLITVILSYIPFDEKIGLSPLPFLSLAIMIVIAVTYRIIEDILKQRF
jgi:hypothetical protein